MLKFKIAEKFHLKTFEHIFMMPFKISENNAKLPTV
jgi:hypothetical protein